MDDLREGAQRMSLGLIDWLFITATAAGFAFMLYMDRKL